MTKEQYFQNLLASQRLTETELAALRNLRDKIQGQLSVFEGSPRFYYGGSYGKDTIIRAKYDLDVVMYWPHTTSYTLAAIFGAVGEQLKKHWQNVTAKNVAWTLPFVGDFHIDVVPGRALDGTFKYANLYRSKNGTPLQTSIKVHIDAVRKSGRRDLIRLMKLWKTRHGVDIPSFVLEVLALEGAKGTVQTILEPQLLAAFAYVRGHIHDIKIADPANTNNNLADTMTPVQKIRIKMAAEAVLSARTWNEVFG